MSSTCSLSLPFKRSSLEEIEEQAADFLQMVPLKYGCSPFEESAITNVDLLLEKASALAGLTVYDEYDNPLSHSCYSRVYGYCDFEENRVYIDRTSKVYQVTQRFTVGHELYHILTMASDPQIKKHIHLFKKDYWTESQASDFSRIIIFRKEPFISQFNHRCSKLGLKNPLMAEKKDIPIIRQVIQEMSWLFKGPGFASARRVKDLNLLGNKQKAEEWLLAGEPKPRYLPKPFDFYNA